MCVKMHYGAEKGELLYNICKNFDITWLDESIYTIEKLVQNVYVIKNLKCEMLNHLTIQKARIS